MEKEYYFTEDGFLAKKLIDYCQKCGKKRTR
jgi:hypothetical protein